ncbi:hypothetical protein IFM89_013724 [Coptis chinensis]|uniref:Cytochrome P450 n=1 Tax=Coptis chinensis TaxID=261450 RepID=A0A835HTG9_9MAGN|nr:hypothetical protein IFM89_013724 [Coptis chinensis]
MKKWFEDLTFNVVVMMMIGKRYVGSAGVGDKNEMQWFQKALSQCLYLFGWSHAMEAFPFLQWINYGGYKGAMKSTARDLDSVFRSWVQEHRQRKLSAYVGDHEDFIDVMISNLEGMEFRGYDHDTIIKATCQEEGPVLGFHLLFTFYI